MTITEQAIQAPAGSGFRPPAPRRVAPQARRIGGDPAQVAARWPWLADRPVEGPSPAGTLTELLASRRVIGYNELAEMIDQSPQSLRAAAGRKRKRLRAGLPLLDTDLLDPAWERRPWPRTEPCWLEGEARRWAMRTGRLELDGVTPGEFRGSAGGSRRRREQLLAHS